MSEEDALRNQQDELVIYRCTDCGKTSVSIGWLHGHIEKHWGFGPFNLIPDPRKTGNYDAHMTKTEVLRVNDYDVVDIEEVDVRG